MKLGLQLGYWQAQPPKNHVALAQEAERLGYDSVWTAEAWGSDAFTPLAWIGAQTNRIKLATGIVQISARTPASTAMHALTLDHLTNGRVILGLGVSGPQVVEGWYGQPFDKPLARTREYVSIIRKILRREEPVANAGPHYPLPYTGKGAWGLGKPLRSIVHPLRADLPIYLGAEGETSAWRRRSDQVPDLTYPTGNTVHYLATGASTGGLFGLYRWVMGPEPSGPGPHFHRTIAESFYVLTGTVRIFDGRDWIEAHPGDFVHVPPGGVHGFRNESGAPASMLLHFAPGAPREDYFEGLVGLADMTDEERADFMRYHDNLW